MRMIGSAAGICLLMFGAALAQDWQAAAGGKMAFEVASVKPSPPGAFRPPNFPLEPGPAFATLRTGEPPRGRFSADSPLIVYITFADWNAQGDEAWYEAVQRDFGMDARLGNRGAGAHSGTLGGFCAAIGLLADRSFRSRS